MSDERFLVLFRAFPWFLLLLLIMWSVAQNYSVKLIDAPFLCSLVCFAVADLMKLVSFVVNTRAVDHGTIVLQFAPSHDYLHYNCTRYLLKRRKRERKDVRNFFTINICSRWWTDEVSFSPIYIFCGCVKDSWYISKKKSAITSRLHNECNEISWFGLWPDDWLVAWLYFYDRKLIFWLIFIITWVNEALKGAWMKSPRNFDPFFI